jgi:hypothetical protein
VAVIELHPEYCQVVESGARAREFEPPGRENPFLHMGLHIAVREQVAVDRPPGVRGLHGRLAARYGQHGADHALMEALQATLEDAQRSGTAPDVGRYIQLAAAALQRCPSSR